MGTDNKIKTSWNDVVSSQSGARYPPEAGRYHLYLGLFCPFACRAYIILKLKGLDSCISTSIVHWDGGERDKSGWRPGWGFARPEDNEPACTSDPVFQAKRLSEIYFHDEPKYQGKYTVPVLFDKKTKTIVNNESLEVLRMLSTAFDSVAPASRRNYTYYPSRFAADIDSLGERLQNDINAGVYKCGMSPTQQSYDHDFGKLFECLDVFDDMLEKSGGPFLFGAALTELDIRLYTTLVRFDPVYFTLFKCNQRMIRNGFKHLGVYLKRLYSIPAFGETTDFHHIKSNYYVGSFHELNPHRIMANGPLPHIEELKQDEKIELDWNGTYEEESKL